MSGDNEQKLQDLLKERSKDGKITCTDCHEISEEYSYSLEEIGQKADEIKIKIVNCKLGCF